MYEETKQHWIRVGVIALITFLVSYLAFFMALKHHLKNLNNPFYQAERMEKFLEKEERNFEKYDKKQIYFLTTKYHHAYIPAPSAYIGREHG